MNEINKGKKINRAAKALRTNVYFQEAIKGRGIDWGDMGSSRNRDEGHP